VRNPERHKASIARRGASRTEVFRPTLARTSTSTSTIDATLAPTTTLPASGCVGVPVGSTFASIGCRLDALLTRVQTEAGLGALQPKLARSVGKAAERTADAVTQWREATLKKARKDAAPVHAIR
jgi:hypothetical protein